MLGKVVTTRYKDAEYSRVPVRGGPFALLFVPPTCLVFVAYALGISFLLSLAISAGPVAAFVLLCVLVCRAVRRRQGRK